jgi:thiamine-phosphate pyrophosphorylase
VGTQRLSQIRNLIKTPLVAIGGIKPENVCEVMEAGADSICVISAVLNAPDITRAAREIIEMIEAKK